LGPWHSAVDETLRGVDRITPAEHARDISRRVCCPQLRGRQAEPTQAGGEHEHHYGQADRELCRD